MDDEEKRLIAEFIQKNGVTQCPTAEAKGGEVGAWTRDDIADKRKKFRADQREKKKNAKNE